MRLTEYGSLALSAITAVVVISLRFGGDSERLQTVSNRLERLEEKIETRHEALSVKVAELSERVTRVEAQRK